FGRVNCTFTTRPTGEPRNRAKDPEPSAANRAPRLSLLCRRGAADFRPRVRPAAARAEPARGSASRAPRSGLADPAGRPRAPSRVPVGPALGSDAEPRQHVLAGGAGGIRREGAEAPGQGGGGIRRRAEGGRGRG